MKFNAINKKKISEIAYICLLAISPLIIAEIYCACFGGSLTKLYLPANVWNDELYYYKIVAGMVKYGLPKGYFGYNEVPAVIGPFATWSPFIFFPYAIWGRIFGWNFNSTYLCNVAFMCIAYGVWATLTREEGRAAFEKKVLRILSLLVMPVLIKYILSGMAEALFFSLTVIWASFWMRGKYCEKLKDQTIMCLIAGYLTLCRPYFVLLFIPYILKKFMGREYRKVLIGIVFPIVSLAGSLVVRKCFCAPYFEETIKFSGIRNSIITFLKGCRNVLWLVKESVNSADLVGEIYFVFLILSVAIVYTVIWRLCNKMIDLDGAFLIVSSLLMLFAVIVMYDLKVGARHLFCIILLDVVFLIERCERTVTRSAVMALLIVAFLLPKSDYYYRPRFNEGTFSELNIKERSNAFEELVTISPNDGWNNTVMYALGTRYQVLYSLPDGVGINCCWSDFLNSRVLNCKYVIINPDMELKLVGYKERYSDEYCILYEKED